jgi:serine/threonine-protein kinase HipA
VKRTLGVHLGAGAEPVGTLHLEAQGARQTAAFEYGAAWLASSRRLALEPGLPLVSGPQFHRRHPDGSLFHGVFADTEPDGWGRKLILRDHVKRRGDARTSGKRVEFPALDDLDYLLAVDDVHDSVRCGFAMNPASFSARVSPAVGPYRR